MQRPNILLLYCDQLRWDAIGANGNREVISPHLDALAQDGTNFSHHFVQHPLCMPSRVSMLTGQYPATLKIPHMGVPVPEHTVTLATLLNGYYTANIGKLHFLPHANREHREPHPSYGFDHLEISDEPGVYEDAYRAWARLKKPEQVDRLSPGLPPARHIWQTMLGIDDGVRHPAKGERDDYATIIPFPGDDDMTHTAFVAEQTIEFIQRQRNANQPFLCISGFYSPHPPLIVPETFLNMYDPDKMSLPDFPEHIELERQHNPRFSDEQLRMVRHGYYAMITELDHHIGRILSALSDSGLAGNTIVVFTSDHGEWLGEHLRYGKGYPADDSVSRVPLIMRVPDMPEGIIQHDIVEAVDIVPTLLDLAGFQIAPHLQGKSLRQLLTGEDSDSSGTSALTEGRGWKTLRTDDYRYLVHEDGREMLWDIRTKQGAYHDVADEDAYEGILQHMRHRLLMRLLSRERPLKRGWIY